MQSTRCLRMMLIARTLARRYCPYYVLKLEQRTSTLSSPLSFQEAFDELFVQFHESYSHKKTERAIAFI